ncbi:MAG: hypothetical protein QM673_06845 [Gordonia sp. (in: high G+C Gram-positive bacteria)]
MTQQAGQPSMDVYRLPLMPGLYPPLGYDVHGNPLFVPGQQPPAAAPYPSPVAAAPYPSPILGSPGPGSPPAGRNRRQRRGPGPVIVIVAVLVALVSVTTYSMHRHRDWADQIADTATDQPRVTIIEPTTVPPGAPAAPGQAGPQRQPGQSDSLSPGQTVSYEATIDGSGTILYVDDEGLRSEFTPSMSWHLDFTSSGLPLRLLVIAGEGSSVSCTIKVGGRTVSTDRVDAKSARRTASCAG